MFRPSLRKYYYLVDSNQFTTEQYQYAKRLLLDVTVDAFTQYAETMGLELEPDKIRHSLIDTLDRDNPLKDRIIIPPEDVERIV